MANAATLTTPKTMDEASYAIRDRILGTLFTIGRGSVRPINLAEVRERMSDVSGGDFDRVISWLDRDGVIALDRGADMTTVKLISSGFSAESVPCSLKDRVRGAIWTAARGPFRFAEVSEVKSRLSDVPASDVERALVALTLQGDVELGRGHEQGWVRLSPFGRVTPMPHAFHMQQPMAQSFMPLYGNPMTYRHQVEQVAHQIWEMRGRQHGQDFQNWIEAEHMVRAHMGCTQY
jgi:hypothetical protein